MIDLDQVNTSRSVYPKINPELRASFKVIKMSADLVAKLDESTFYRGCFVPGKEVGKCRFHLDRVASSPADIVDDTALSRYLGEHRCILPPAASIPHHHDTNIKAPSVHFRQRDGLLNDMPSAPICFPDSLIQPLCRTAGPILSFYPYERIAAAFFPGAYDSSPCVLSVWFDINRRISLQVCG